MTPKNQHPEADHDDVSIGVEIEFAAVPEGGDPLRSEGVPVETEHRAGMFSSHTQHLRHANGGQWSYERIGRGINSVEARTPNPGVPFCEITDWYVSAINEVEHRFGFDTAFTGLSEGCVVGLHTHLSPLTEEQAKLLFEFSSEPWMPVFVSSSLASRTSRGESVDKFPVIRERGEHFCDFSRGFGNHHYCPVNKHRKGGLGHYEWRVPEPVTPEHFELIVEFLARFMDDPDSASEWAQELVYDGDDRLTAYQRARAIGDELRGDSPTKTHSTAIVEDVVFN